MLVSLLQTSFLCLETGFTRVAHTSSMYVSKSSLRADPAKVVEIYASSMYIGDIRLVVASSGLNH